MSVDYCPTCPDCGDDLVYDPHREFSVAAIIYGRGEWICPDCGKSYDIPEGPLPEPEPE